MVDALRFKAHFSDILKGSWRGRGGDIEFRDLAGPSQACQ